VRRRNPDSLWNPAVPVEVTPKDYELQVLEWLRQVKGTLIDFQIGHLEKLAGSSGEYEFDIVAKFSIFEGAEIVVLAECKRYRRPVERDDVLALHSKLRDVGAQKAMMFSTGGFQSGAIKYASAHGIATLNFIDGGITYETRNYGPPVTPPPWVDLPRFAAHRLSAEEEKKIRVHLLKSSDVEAINEWLAEGPEHSVQNRETDS
jgi:restriction system protein